MGRNFLHRSGPSSRRPLYERFLTWFGDLKYYRYPLFLLWNPQGYLVGGEELRGLLGLIQPGDILLRAFKDYVDGLFIPGAFSHAGLYLGAVDESDRPLAGALCADEAARARGAEAFRHGPQMVAHAMAEGVFLEDLLQFARCDYLLVLRLPARLSGSPAKGAVLPSRLPWLPREQRLLEQFRGASGATRDEAIGVARVNALGRLGSGYDFGFDFETHARFSCTEFVFYCYRAVAPVLGLHLKTRRILWVSRRVLEPDDFLASDLRPVWRSASCARLCLPEQSTAVR